MPKIVDHDEQRAEIAACAAQYIARRGLETLSLRNVAGAHGCSKGMVQHYFADKEELLHGALLHVNTQYQTRERAAIEGVQGIARLEKRLLVILPLDTALREEWVVRLAFYARAAQVPRMQAYLMSHVAAALREGVADLRHAQRAGEIRKGGNLSRAYRMIIATVAGIAVSEVVSPRVLQPATQKRMLRDAISILR